MATRAQKWKKLIVWLRKNFSPHLQCYIRTISLKNLCGQTERKEKKFLIKIHKNQCFALRIDTLIHEWAHALVWFGAETNNEDHSAEWGIQYAKIYRTFLEWNWGEGPDEEG